MRDGSAPPSATGAARRASVGVVAIGRNEGERLRRCLEAVGGAADRIVYVDSGSTDGSVELARALGADVVELDPRTPFSPGRARNEGFRRLGELHPDVRYVQFVDGDCEIAAGWLTEAAGFLDEHQDVAVVAGRRRELHPERSVYNLTCAIEWELHPVGEAAACGGDALMRVDAFAASEGYRVELMGGEEPDLCQRLRAAGWRIWLQGRVMTVHDAAMTRFGQWWRRNVRSGYAGVQRAWLYGVPRGEHGVREVLGTFFWAALLPVAIAVATIAVSPWYALLLLAYVLQIAKLALQGSRRTQSSWRAMSWYAAFLVMAKLPKLVGYVTFLAGRLRGSAPRLIEYKSVTREPRVPRV